MTAPVTSPAAQEFLAAVQRELEDLPAEERGELLEDLEQHLLAVEADGDERSLTTRLGTATDYAAELRAAAGLPPREAVARKRSPRLRRMLSDLLATPFVLDTRAFVPTLKPAWWVLRGYLVVLLPCLWNVSGSRDFPFPAPLESKVLGVIAVLAAIIASVSIGRRRMPRPLAVLAIAVNVALLVAAFNLLHDAPWRLAQTQVVYAQGELSIFRDSPLATENGPVTDIYPYAADGTPLSGVLLYDQDGRPLQTGQQLWFADRCRRVLSPPLALDGAPVPFSYPQTYVLDRTGVDLDGNPVQPGQCKALTRVTIAPPALVAPTKKPVATKPVVRVR